MEITIVFKGCRITTNTRIRLQDEICAAIDKSPDKINILFATTGGVIKEGINFYEFARKLEVPIDIYNFGEISSAGTVMYLAFANRYFLKNTKFLFHAVRLEEGLELTDIRLENRARLNEEMLNIYLQHANLPSSYYFKMQDSLEDIPLIDPNEIKQFLNAIPSDKKFHKPFQEIKCE